MNRSTIERCLSDIGRCPDEFVGRAGYELVRPVVDQYLGALRNQAASKWQRLSPEFVVRAQPYYTADLSRVRFATGINTVHGQAITIGYEVFFPGQLNLARDKDIVLMLHELEHVVQYANRGGVEPFLAEYLLKSVGQVVSRRSFDVHDFVDIEAAAIRKSKDVFVAAWGYPIVVRNGCEHEVRVAVTYFDKEGSWVSTGWWTFDPEEEARLSMRGDTLRSSNRIFYAYAETLDRRLTWAGDLQREIDSSGRTVGFLKIDRSRGEIDNLKFNPVCRNR